MSDPAPRTRIQQKNRTAILAAGLDMFSQYGFRGTTLDQIAEAAGLSKPNLLYYFRSKDAIYTALLERLLETWLDPLIEMRDDGDPVEEILGYALTKLELSRDFPRESRLFATEILQGAPHIADHLTGELRALVAAKGAVIDGWAATGKIRPVSATHLIFSIWALTQHYADFDVQVRAVTGKDDNFDDARTHLEQMIRAVLQTT